MTEHGPESDGLIPSELAQDDDSFIDLVEEFLGGLPRRIEEFDTALAGNDFDSLRRCAHQLKGAGGGYGYPALSDLASRVEKDAMETQAQACIDGVGELKELIARMVVRLD